MNYIHACVDYSQSRKSKKGRYCAYSLEFSLSSIGKSKTAVVLNLGFLVEGAISDAEETGINPHCFNEELLKELLNYCIKNKKLPDLYEVSLDKEYSIKYYDLTK